MARRNWAGKYGKRKNARYAQSAMAARERAWEVVCDYSTEQVKQDALEEVGKLTSAMDRHVAGMYAKGVGKKALAEQFADQARQHRIGRDVGKYFTGYVVLRDEPTQGLKPHSSAIESSDL
ncbi:MAG: hypothetical protein WAQ24_00675 [Candidatus Saccharimonadales bacterium]